MFDLDAMAQADAALRQISPPPPPPAQDAAAA
jgi:hypothetical protein